ncbi:hypothetical protein IWW36_000201 [Coemansia brasiliensis]|uniref:Uncharacterized protein n=1 Tax=Coemansia brasiliensis TaxID=2650707 RepID=A0A9W8IE00_9FUNG|nr:hypothetical protein IWW36_000201 [Coemansia brasiliensis]
MANTTWEPERYANLNRLLGDCLELSTESPKYDELKKQLEKLKPDLASLLEFPAKNAQHRTALEKGTPTINGEQYKVSTDFIAEAKKLSDFLEIDEDLASTLVHKAVGYEKRFELAAGESAVLLFFSEREAKLLSLSTLFAGGASAAVEEGMRGLLDQFASEILSSTLKAAPKMFPERVLEAIGSLASKKDRVTRILEGPSADIPYQREVVEFVQTRLSEERKQLAMVLFVIIRDYQLNSNELLSVVEWLRNSKVDDPVTLRLAVALLTALNTAAEGSHELAEVAALDKISHLVRDSEFLVKLHAEIVDKAWNDDGLKGLVWLQWALLALFGMKRSPGFDQLIGFREDRVESIAEQAVRMGAYRCATDYLLGYRISDDMEYELASELEVLQKQRVEAAPNKETSQRYPHFKDVSEELQWHIESTLEDMVASFIGRMSSLIRRMRYNEEDAIYQAQQAEQLRQAQEEQRQQMQQMQQSGLRYSRPIGSQEVAPPATAEPRRDTESLFLWITVLFSGRPDAGLRFWGRANDARMELDDRLAVFLRWGADCREQGMVRGYFSMLAALAGGVQASVSAHEFMSGGALSPRQAANQAPLCSWQALFGALDFYAGHMRQNETDPLAAAAEIPAAEESLLRAFLRLCATVVRFSVVARTALYDSAELNAMATMFGLLGSGVPVGLKAALLNTIAAFGEADDAQLAAQGESVRLATDEMARRIWGLLEQSQMVPTANKSGAGALTIGRGRAVRGGIAYELEEIEAAAETYPETRAFVGLVATLMHVSRTAPTGNDDRDPVAYGAASPSVPADLGAGHRVAGAGPYVGFVVDSVLLKADQRTYRAAGEKWQVYEQTLAVVERSLATLDLSAFAGGRTVNDANTLRTVATQAGFEVAVRILCGSRLLDTLLRVLDVGVDAVNAGAAAGRAVLAALRILLRVLRIETAVLQGAAPALAESDALGFALSLPRSLTTLEQLLLARRAAVVQLVTYVGAVDADISLAAVRIVRILAASTAFSGVDDRVGRGALTLNRLVSIVDGSAESVRILHAFIGVLEADDGSSDATVATAAGAVQGEASGAETPAQTLRLATMDLLLENIAPSKPAPTLSHWLLGFGLARPASDDLPDPSQRATALHAILDTIRGERAADVLLRQPRLGERCYQLVHRLCADAVTGDVTQRYLRAREDFVATQLRAVPAEIAARGVCAQLHARAWLWRLAALELHALALQDSRARARQIAEWLVADTAAAQDDDVFAAGAGSFLDAQMRLLALFDGVRTAYRDALIELHREQHTYDDDAMDEDAGAGDDDAALLGIDVTSCEAVDKRGCLLVDMQALAALLRAAERALEARGALNTAGARQRAHAAMRRVAVRAFFDNQQRELFFAFSSALRGWKEMAEVVVTSAWELIDAGGRSARERTAFQLLRGLARALAESDASMHLPAEPEQRRAEVMTALATTLTLCAERLSREWARAGELSRAALPPAVASGPNKGGTRNRAAPPAAPAESLLPAEPLLDAWRLLVAAALTPAAQTSLQLRGNVYAALLHFAGGLRRLAGDDSASRLVAGALDVLAGSSLGDRLLETVSADAADASDAWKTVAFALLDALATLYANGSRSTRVVVFLARKNYLSAFIGTLLRRDDAALQSCLQPDPASLNALYVYEAKLAFFIRLAQRADGADKLIENGILDVLADCAFLDMRPNASSDAGSFADAFIPARAERFHQLLMPALDLLLALAARIGRDNVAVWMKLARFVTQHFGVLEAVLKEVALPSQPLSIALLTEAKAISALVFFVARQRAVLDREAALAGAGHVGITSLHLPLLALLPKLASPSAAWMRRLNAANDVERAQSQVPATLYDAKEDCDMAHSLLGQQASELVDATVQNVIAYVQAVTERSSAASRPFRPAFAWPIEHSRESDYLPSQSLLVAYIRHSLSRISRGRAARKEKLRLAQNSSEMPSAELRRLISASAYSHALDDLSMTQMRSLAAVLLTQQARHIARCSSAQVAAMEQALVLLWRHLSFFITSDIVDDASYAGSRVSGNVGGSMAMPSLAERDTLRTDASISLPPLLSSLSDLKLTTDELPNYSTHTSFIQMLVRRIKDLVLRDISSL